MNATEQRTHRTRTDELSTRIEALETIIAALSDNNATLYAMCETLHRRVKGLEEAHAAQIAAQRLLIQ